MMVKAISRLIFVCLLFSSFSSHAKQEPEKLDEIVEKSEETLCNNHNNPAKCHRDIAVIIWMASTNARIYGYCSGGSGEMLDCKESERIYDSFRMKFEKAKNEIEKDDGR